MQPVPCMTGFHQQDEFAHKPRISNERSQALGLPIPPMFSLTGPIVGSLDLTPGPILAILCSEPLLVIKTKFLELQG